MVYIFHFQERKSGLPPRPKSRKHASSQESTYLHAAFWFSKILFCLYFKV